MAEGERREYRGAAAATTLDGAISAGATSISLVDTTNWPDGSVGPFFIVIDRGLSSEEKIKCISRTGDTLTVVTSPSSGRGADSTVATSHVSGAAVEHVWTADDADKLNAHINDLNDNHQSLLNTTRHDTTARHAVGTVIGSGTPGSSAVGDAAAAGVATTVARSDHKHGRESFGNPAASGVGDSMSAGSGATVARANHVHARENFGSASNVSTAISDGTSSAVSHADHVHAAPFHPRVLNRTNTSLVGGTPPSAGSGTANWIMQMGNTTATTNGSGFATYSFPSSFTNGVVTVLVGNGDSAYTQLSSATTSGFTVLCSVQSGGVVSVAGAGVSVTVPWVAYGW